MAAGQESSRFYGFFRNFCLKKTVTGVFKKFALGSDIGWHQVHLCSGQDGDHTFAVILYMNVGLARF